MLRCEEEQNDEAASGPASLNRPGDTPIAKRTKIDNESEVTITMLILSVYNFYDQLTQ